MNQNGKLLQLKKEIKSFGSAEKAEFAKRFFKSGKGEYGEGDIFLGLTVPEQRKIASGYTDLSLPDLQKLLDDRIHEYRFVALVILMHKYKKADKEGKKEIFDFYIKNTLQVNNWDLVDVSAPGIVGDYLSDKDKKILYRLARSKNHWERRIAIVATFAFIRKNEFGNTLAIAEILLSDMHDLIHKAVGWMLREVGIRDVGALYKFLDKHCKVMPRTTLRYSLEKFEKKKKEFYMGGKG